MGAETFDYTAIIADLEAKRAALDATLTHLRMAHALGALGQGDGSAVVPSTLSPFSVSGGDVPAGAFLGKSIPEAAKLYLALTKRKQTSREIAEALKKGGIESQSKSFNTQVHSILDRARKAGSGIVKLDRSYWGLSDWYPASMRIGGVPEKRASRPKRRKGKLPLQAFQPETEVPKAGLGAQERIISFLSGKGYVAPKDIADRTSLKIQTAHLLLGKLVNSKQVDKSPDGHYKLAATN